MDTLNTEQALEMIVQGVQAIAAEHAALTERTNNPMFLALIALSRQWWLRWYAISLCEVADCDLAADRDAVGELNAALHETEVEIIKRAGQRGYDTFAAWAEGQNVGFEAPIRRLRQFRVVRPYGGHEAETPAH